MWVRPSLNGFVATDEDSVSRTEARACETLDEMSRIRSSVGGLNQTGDERAPVVDLVNE